MWYIVWYFVVLHLLWCFAFRVVLFGIGLGFGMCEVLVGVCGFVIFCSVGCCYAFVVLPPCGFFIYCFRGV